MYFNEVIPRDLGYIINNLDFLTVLHYIIVN